MATTTNKKSQFKLIEEKIIRNSDLVQKIKESAAKPSAPMTVEEFKKWLNQ